MSRKAMRMLWAACLALCAAMSNLAAGWAGSLETEKPPQQEAEKRGTGVVPPGVKLEAQMPSGATAKPFRFPKAATRPLPNGLRIFVIPSSGQPSVTVRLVLTTAGAVHDPAGKPGVAAMTANLLTQGTTKRSAQQIAEAIDFVGGTLSAGIDSDGTFVTASVVKKDFDLGMDLLSDVVLNAALPKEELERRRQQLLSGLSVQYADPSYLASVVFSRVVYGQHPYGLPDDGTPDSVRKLERDDMVRFRDTYYLPNGALLAFAGDITPEAAFAAAEKYLGSWQKKELAAAPPSAPNRTRGLRFFLVDKPDAVQTQIRIGRLGIQRNNPDYIPLLVTNRIFGGGFNSRLSTEVRIHKGLTYGAYSRFDSRRQAGSFVALTFTRTEATAEATKLVVDLISKMASGEVTKEELAFARDYLAGVFPIQSETAEQVADRILTVAEYDLPADYNDTYREKVSAVGPEQVQAMAQRYFDVQDLHLVLVGNVKEFRDALKKDFPNASFEEIPYEQLDLLSPNLRRPKEVAAAPTPAGLERGKAILAAAAEAAGGASLAKVESLEVSSTGQLFTPQGQFDVQIRVQVAYPDRVRTEIQLPMGTIVQSYDGKVAWTQAGQNSAELPAKFSAEFQRGIDLTGGWGVYRKAVAGQVEAQYLGEEEVEGKKALAVEWLVPRGAEGSAPSQPIKLYFDPETLLLTAAKFRANTPQGAFDTEQRWSDFHAVRSGAAALQFPYHTVTYRDGAKFSEQTVQEVKLKTQPDASIFAKPK